MHNDLKGPMIRKSFNLLLIAIIALGVSTLAPSSAFAQAKSKPKLVSLKLSERTNDPKALSIAKKLDPDFFDIDQEYMGGSPDAKFFARFVPLDKTNPKAFIALSVSDTPYHCTARGCPTRIFVNKKGNQWSPALDLMVHKIWYDLNTKKGSKNNIITQNLHYANKATSVWMWSAGKYIKVRKK